MLAFLFGTTIFLSGCFGGGAGPAPEFNPGDGGGDDYNFDEDGEFLGSTTDFSDYFSGYTIYGDGGDSYEVYDDASPGWDDKATQVTFNKLLDRQFDVLAQDLIYRLIYVYGYPEEEESYVNYWTNSGTSDKSIKTGDSDYKLVIDGVATTAYVSNFNLLVDRDYNGSEQTPTQYDLEDIHDFQKAILYRHRSDNYLASPGYLYFPGAIEGRYTSLDDNNILRDVCLEENRWLWSVGPGDKTDYDTYIKEYKDNLKMALALMYTENEAYEQINESFVFDEKVYKQELNKIDALGVFSDQYKADIENFIFKNIIGDDLVDKDNFVYDTYFHENSIINADFINDPYYDNAKSGMRFYKAYGKVVPALVDRAFENEFCVWSLLEQKYIYYNSIYPIFERVNVTNGAFESTTYTNSKGEKVEEVESTGYVSVNNLILKPKKDSAPVALYLEMRVAREYFDNDDNKKLAHDIIVELEIEFIYHRGEEVFKGLIMPETEDSATLSMSAEGYFITEIDYEHPDFDPSRASEPGYLDDFKVKTGTSMPYSFVFSFFDPEVDDETYPAFNNYNGSNENPVNMSTFFNNDFKLNKDGTISVNSGTDYIELKFTVKSAKQFTDETPELIDYNDGGIVFDIALLPFTF